MKYRNAKDVLPAELLSELQKYVSGQLLYVPSSDQPKGWGQTSGSRERLLRRNRTICGLYHSGWTVTRLAETYFLSVDSIKKIVYGKSSMTPPFAPDIESAEQYGSCGMAEEWVRLWLQAERGIALPEDGVTVDGIVRIPLRLIRGGGCDETGSHMQEKLVGREPLVLRFREGHFWADDQPVLLSALRSLRHNAYPALIILPKAAYAAYMYGYGRYFLR